MKDLFIDKARIFVKAGNGGNGSVSFRRENMFQQEAQTAETVVVELV